MAENIPQIPLVLEEVRARPAAAREALGTGHLALGKSGRRNRRNGFTAKSAEDAEAVFQEKQPLSLPPLLSLL